MTTRGMTPTQMPQVAAWIDEVVTAVAKGNSEDVAPRVRQEVVELTRAFRPPA